MATRIGLLILNGFVAISAIAGAIWVVPTMPMEWIKYGPFTDWTIPAIALEALWVRADRTRALPQRCGLAAPRPRTAAGPRQRTTGRIVRR